MKKKEGNRCYLNISWEVIMEHHVLSLEWWNAVLGFGVSRWVPDREKAACPSWLVPPWAGEPHSIACVVLSPELPGAGTLHRYHLRAAQVRPWGMLGHCCC